MASEILPGPAAHSTATGRGVRVAIVDSGVHAAHPHVGRVAGGIAIDQDGHEHDDYVDRLGHGTAVAAAIREKAPDADLYAIRVFQDALSTNITTLVQAIEWAVRSGAHIVNLSLGTTRPAHEAVLRDAVAHAVARGVAVVAAREDEGVRWLPGSLPGVVPVLLDWTCPRDQYRVEGINGSAVFRASGFPREIPGVPPARNLNGVSFAVANMSGFAARAREGAGGMSVADVVRALAGR